MRATGYIGASNKAEYSIRLNGELFDLTAAGVVRVEVVEGGQVLSSDTTAVSFSGSNLSIEWGALNLESGPYSPTVYAYKAGDNKGEVLFGELESPIYLMMVEDERP